MKDFKIHLCDFIYGNIPYMEKVKIVPVSQKYTQFWSLTLKQQTCQQHSS